MALSKDNIVNLVSLFNTQKYTELEDLSHQLIDQSPISGFAWKMLGVSLQMQGKYALPVLQKTTELSPNDAGAFSNLGNALQKLGYLDDAILNYKRAIEIDPSFAQAYNNLGNVLQEQKKYEEAVGCYHRAIELNPEYSEAYNNLGSTFQERGRIDEAIENFHHAIDLGNLTAYGNLLFCLTHTETDPKLLLQEHLKFANQFENPLKSSWHHTNIKDPQKILKVGFISADFRNHSVGNLIKSIFKYMCNDPSLIIYAYYNHTEIDDVTTELQKYPQHWINVFGMTDEILVKRIKDDGIDILVDLSGHTAGNCMSVLLHKPAPIQVTWLGYPGTTGTECIDYYIADRFFLPPEFVDQFTEKLAYIPATFVPHIPDFDYSDVNELPMIDNGFVTFGSFNRRDKISESVVSVWSKILKTLPNSRMIIGGIPEQSIISNWFEREGIVSDRITFIDRVSMDDYMKTYNYVDICLDTFPYTGGITTIYGAWMGVPTVTLANNTAVGRLGVLTLSQVGLSDLIAYNTEEFVQIALNLANDPDRLIDIRSELQDRLKKSPMGQPKLVVDSLCCVFRTMWQRWCNDLPPISI